MLYIEILAFFLLLEKHLQLAFILFIIISKEVCNVSVKSREVANLIHLCNDGKILVDVVSCFTGSGFFDLKNIFIFCILSLF